MEASEIVNDLVSKKITEEEAIRLIESYKKPKKTVKTTAKKGRPKTKERSEKYLAIATFWVTYSSVAEKHKLKTKLRGILADAFKVDDSYIGKCLSRLKKMLNSGNYHVYKSTDDNEAVIVMFLTTEELDLIINQPEESVTAFKSGKFLPNRRSY